MPAFTYSIMQSLKQLSFLASGNTMSNVTNTMAPPQPMYQQPLPQPNNYTHDVSSSISTYMKWNNDSNRSQSFL